MFRRFVAIVAKRRIASSSLLLKMGGGGARADGAGQRWPPAPRGTVASEYPNRRGGRGAKRARSPRRPLRRAGAGREEASATAATKPLELPEAKPSELRWHSH